MRNEDTRPRRAFLGMPGYGEATAGAARGLYRASRGASAPTPIDLTISYAEGSLLAQNFNALWCQALNACVNGDRVHYFAMLHADVEPEDFWLDKLVAEMEATGLDVLGTVVPIKDPKGLTSLALARDDGDTWRPHCRLTMREVFSLPETFTSADCGRPLLLNTGCWVCRFDPEWAGKVSFTINDRIVLNSTTGLYQAQVEPEDWYFSRLCHEIGLKVGATRKVALMHAGKMRFTNTEPWGSEHFDAAYAKESPIRPAATVDNFHFPEDADGWLTPSEGRALYDLAKGKQRVLEIGSYCGRSTICLAQGADHVVAIDPFDGRGTPRPRKTFDEFDRNLRQYGVRHKVDSLIGTTDTAAPFDPFDLVFIDGAHDADSVQADVRYARRNLKPGGLLVFHDYGVKATGVTMVVNDLVKCGGAIVSTHSTVAVVRPPGNHNHSEEQEI